jgi:hypothetical protein
MNELVELTKEMQAPDGVSKTLIQKMSVFFQDADQQKTVIDSIVVTKPDQKAEMQQAREIRLQIKNKRIEARDIVKAEREKLKNAMADFTLQDKLWLKSFQMLEAVCDNLEYKCEEKEKFAERWEEDQKQLRYDARVKKLYQYDTDLSIYNLEDMSDEAFDRLLANEKLVYESRMKSEKEAEVKRIAEAKAEADRQEAISKENEVLRAEAVKRDAEIAKERKAREAVEAKARAEKESQLAKEQAERAKADAEAKAQEEATRAKLLAPDKEKLIDLATSIEMLQLPAVQSKEAMAVIRATQDMISKMSGYIRDKAQTL